MSWMAYEISYMLNIGNPYLGFLGSSGLLRCLVVLLLDILRLFLGRSTVSSLGLLVALLTATFAFAILALSFLGLRKKRPYHVAILDRSRRYTAVIFGYSFAGDSLESGFAFSLSSDLFFFFSLSSDFFSPFSPFRPFPFFPPFPLRVFSPLPSPFSAEQKNYITLQVVMLLIII